MNVNDAIRNNPMTRFQWTVVIICITITVIDGYEILVAAFVLPALTTLWGLDNTQAGLLASIGTLGMAFGAVLLSPLADRLGRRRHILICLAAIVVFMGISGLAPDFTFLLIFRFIAGLFLGGIVPSINVLVAEYASDARRGQVMGIYGIGFPLGAAVGGFLSVWLISTYTWRGPFIFSAIVTAVVLVWCWFALPESANYLVTKRPAGALAQYNRIGARLGLAPAAELPAAPVPATAQSVGKDVWRGVMLVRTLLLWLAYGSLIAAFYFANTWTARLVAQATGNDNIGITAQALVATGGVIGALLFAFLSVRLHPRIVTVMIMFAGTVAFALFGNFFTATAIVMVLAVFVGVAANGGVAAYYAISPPIYPTAVRASAVGQMMGFGRAVAFLAPNIAALLLNNGWTPPAVYEFYAGVLVVSGLAALALHRTYRGANSLDAMEIESALAGKAAASAN